MVVVKEQPQIRRDAFDEWLYGPTPTQVRVQRVAKLGFPLPPTFSLSQLLRPTHHQVVA
jgi:hypothetical protein